MSRQRIAMVLGAALLAAGPLGVASANAAPLARVPALVHIGEVAAQDIPPTADSEPDTTVEPDVAVSPRDPNIAVAVAHDGRKLTGGAITITYSWTHDGGRTWHHQPLPHLSKPQGGRWDGASDPTVAFGPDGTVYISSLLTSDACPNGLGVSRSTDGGVTFSDPVLVDSDPVCSQVHSDDKEIIAVDTSRSSPHYGRVYLFWTSLQLQTPTLPAGSPQYLRWSDDHGVHWSSAVRATAPAFSVQGAQPMIRADGTITISYFDYGSTGAEEDATAVRPAAADADGPIIYQIRARTSRDGGRTWSGASSVNAHIGYGPADVRCCIPAGTIDPRTGRMYVVWNGVDPRKVFLSTSIDGKHWSAARQVNQDAHVGLEHVNAEVSAYGGRVFVSYGTRDSTREDGRYLQEQVSTSYDHGVHFGPALSLGPAADLKYAAIGGGKPFPGDYIGSAATAGRTYLVWSQSSPPADPAATYHQVTDGATLRP